MTETNWTDDKAAQVLMAMAINLRTEGKTPRAEACEYAAARLMSIPSLTSQLTHPSITSHAEQMQQLVRFVVNGGETPE